LYFNVNFNVFFKLIKAHLLVSELYIHAFSLNQLSTFKPCSSVEDNLGSACMTQPLQEYVEVMVAVQTLG